MKSTGSALNENFFHLEEAKLPSDRTFGLMFSAIFVFIGLWPLVSHEPARLWAIAVAAILFLVAMLYPPALLPFNIAWYKLGRLLHWVTNPIFMALIFYGLITPAAFILRIIGKDLLSLRTNPAAPSYWVPRGAEDNRDERMTQQF